jgi:hypothetical protein
MSNAPSKFTSRGTRVFHGHAGGAITECRFVSREGTTGDVIQCPTVVRPIGVSPRTYADGDDCDYHRGGIASVETDGSAAVGDYVLPATDGSGKAIKDSSPGSAVGVYSAGRLLTLDTTTNIGDVELFF